MASIEPIRITPIGSVKSAGEVSEIVVHEQFAPGLEGIDNVSHLFIIYWMHRAPSSNMEALKVRPGGRADVPFVGVFATRVTRRPNPVGLTLVELVGRKNNVLKVKGLDAIEDTPIIDIKPFNRLDMALGAKFPEWWPLAEW